MSITPHLKQQFSRFPCGCKPSDADPEPDGAEVTAADYHKAAQDLIDHQSFFRLSMMECGESEWVDLVRAYRNDLQELAEKYADDRQRDALIDGIIDGEV